MVMPRHDMGIVTVAVLACGGVAVAVAAVAFFLVLRALRRSTAREASLRASLVRQNDALRQAERKSLNKTNAFAGASHDIRSALAAITALVDVSRAEAQQTNPQMLQNLEQMDVCTNKLLGILNSILDTSKVESGKMQLDEAEFNVASVLEESMDMISIVGLSKGLEVVWDPCDLSILKCGNVVGDCRRLKQILDNVLGNSVKFTQQGHVVLLAWANRPIIARSSVVCVPSRFGGCSSFLCLFKGREHHHDCCSFSSIQNDPNSVELYFEVDDTGIGIPKEKRELVFEDYVQVKDGQGGTGLGLGIVQSFVRLMGGEISIKDKGPGKTGTCIGFNVFMKMGGIGIHEQHDIEEGSSSSHQCCIGASAFREANASFEGGHCMLLVHGDETRRVLQAWLENLGMKVWLVPELESLASVLDNVCHVSSASLSRTSSDSFECHTDFCFRSRDTVNQILPVSLKSSSSSLKRSGVFGANNWSGVLVVIDAHYGKMENVSTEVNFPEIKKHIPCKIVCLADANTSSGDLGRLRHHTCCDLVLQKPVHGSRLYALLNTLKDLQMAQAHHHHPSHVNPENAAETTSPENAAMAALAQSSSSELKREEEEKSLAGRRVLLVEDTLTLQTIGKKILHQLGADVEVAEDGAKAVSMFEAALAQAAAGSQTDAVASIPYDVILMDCQMPVMDGYEATRRIREAESRYGGVHTPIIALTAHAVDDDEEQRHETIAAGMDLHLTKPMERRSIAQAIRRVCGMTPRASSPGGLDRVLASTVGL